ncbi:hypothetical protein RB623_10695 [Mesorhizobium sp. LHD-90]|uniref:hypothetical protein n=1 Tax=Mesorhizobium sp. LHD-90 TaxID=3071414 RepID=UPI0027DFA084|nr:hypothetical protein [Mesorhizobium sp. LHD-90]MDQ6434517.1 hypothetical protein [Mesorhizobium sp. LHD-90]
MPAEKRTPEGMYNALVEALPNGQRRTVAHLETLATRVDELTREMVKFSRNQIQLRSDVAELRAEVDVKLVTIDRRFEAILARLDELDAVVDKNADDIRKMRIEIVGQYNDILNALQSGHQAKLDIDEINARLDELERRAGLR